MTESGKHTYVGFGFGAIQAGLFLYEAFRTGLFKRLVAAEVVPEAVKAVRENGGYFSLNIAHPGGVEQCRIGPIEIYDPSNAKDRSALIEAVAESQEIGTAVPSIRNYESGGKNSIHRILAEGLRQKTLSSGRCAAIYCAENHNYAAEILEESVMAEIPKSERDNVCSRVRFLDTVIGKMSGVISDRCEIAEQKLAAITPGAPRAFLVEEFNSILISRIKPFDNCRFSRGLAVFKEKDDLMPFCEAKLFGHNATHALAGYLGAMLKAKHIAELHNVPGMMPFLRAAFIEESGAALIHKHSGKDSLFTSKGYRAFAEDLLERMTNPFLRDSVERVVRETERKLGWDDRLIGTIRVALKDGIEPKRYAFGAVAALVFLDPSLMHARIRAEERLVSIWKETPPERSEMGNVLRLIRNTMPHMKKWQDSGYPNLHEYFTNL